MSCECGDNVNRGGWGMVPELALAGDALGSSVPKRAPGPGRRHWPTWVWVLIGVGVLLLWRRG
jgi:hypothetical protein